jgi:hypothetical protein
VSGGAGALLVSPFNMEWGCYVWAGGVEESEFCLFSVVFPAKCFFSVSPRFYFRKHDFCFLPLFAILECSTLLPAFIFCSVLSNILPLKYLNYES